MTDSSNVSFSYGGTGAVNTAVLATLRGGPAVLVKAGFGATGDGTTNDTAAFSNALTRAQALGVGLYVAKGTYRVGAWEIARGSGAVDIVLAPDAIMKLPDSGGGANNAILTIKEDYVTVTGGIWDGNSSILTTGEQYAVKAFSGVTGEQITGVTFSPNKVQNVTGGGFFLLGGRDCHAIGGYYTGSTLNCIAYVPGNSATVSFDTDLTDCTIQDVLADRSNQAIDAEQGCIKISSNGTLATSMEARNCRIINCIAMKPETDTEYNGNIPIEIWVKGQGNQVVGCTTYGGYIGISLSKEQNYSEIVDCITIGAHSVGQELAAVSNCKVVNPTVIGTTGNGATQYGVRLDFQLYTSYVTIPSNLACNGGNISGITVIGVHAIAPALPSGNTFQGRKIRISDVNITLAANDAVGVVVQNIEDFAVDAAVDGGVLLGSSGAAPDGSRDGIVGVRTSRLAGQQIQIGRAANATIRNIQMAITSLDGTGSGVSFIGASGTWGTVFPAKFASVSPFGVKDASFSEVSPLGYGSSIWTGGVITGSPEGVVEAAVGSMLQRSDGGAGTCLYVKETSPTASTGWVGK